MSPHLSLGGPSIALPRRLWQLAVRKSLTAYTLLCRALKAMRAGRPQEAASVLLSALAGVFREYNPRRYRSRRRKDAFDERTGYDTSGIVRVAALRTVSRNWIWGTYYRATEESTFWDLMSSIALPWQEFVFVDCGVGKGRTIIMAVRLPFKRIEGVEFCPSLHRIAMSNLDKLASSGVSVPEVRLWCMDVLDYELPSEPLLVYMYHPFEEPIMERLRGKIERSWLSKPRKFAVAYVAPKCAHVWDRSTIFVRRLEGNNWKAWFSWDEREAG